MFTISVSTEESNHSPIDVSNHLTHPDHSSHTPQLRRSASPDSESSFHKYSPKRLKLQNTDQQQRQQSSTQLPPDSIANMSLHMNKSGPRDKTSETISPKNKSPSPVQISSSHIKITANGRYCS